MFRSYLAADLINGFAAQEPCPSSDFSSTAADNSGIRISNGLMHIDNRSLASLAQRGSIGPGRGVGVGELREALGTNTPLLFLSASISLTDISRFYRQWKGFNVSDEPRSLRVGVDIRDA